MTTIHCPHCHRTINIEDALEHQLMEKFVAKHEAEKKQLEKHAQQRLEQERKVMEQNLTRKLEDQYRIEMEMLRKQNESKSKELQILRKQELVLREEKDRLEALRQTIDLEIQRKLDSERQSIVEKVRQQERQHLLSELNFQEESLSMLREQVNTLKANELELRKEKQRLEELQETVDLEVQRKIDKERANIAEKARLQEREHAHFQLKQKDHTLEMLRQQLEDMKRKTEKASPQVQGEVQEMELKNVLSEVFPMDCVEEIQKGVNGADIIHIVQNNSGKKCGGIAIESKRTKAFNNNWIEKLKEDMLRHGCEFGVIVSEAMPDGKPHIVQAEPNIWICPFSGIKGLVLVLRDTMLRLDAIKTVQSNSREKMRMLYDYLTSSEFKQQLEIIFGGFRVLEANLAKEKRAMQKLWKEREKQLNKVYLNALDFYGSISGIAGADIVTLKILDLETRGSLPESEDAKEM